MGNYLLDTNVIIKLWNKEETIFNDILQENEIIVIDEILKELSKKERRLFKGELVMSERFMKLIPYRIELHNIMAENFIKEINFDHIKGKFYYYKGKKISKNDLLLIVALKEESEFYLVTEDFNLSYIAKELLGENRVLNIKDILM
ncbi:hypothetical protein [Clostridium perfringens]|uniref:hypothetical protein n=1 Tax=Clostridium perfringens TaxID=1502 RepID=UPI001094B1D4|nr:hypothetical protein [Clostridium perfringens]MDZ5129918.1 hypothetical protein [Clostridium perfringens]TGY46802.1 hypothetical protein E5346_03930 [Clostridium perfringens]